MPALARLANCYERTRGTGCSRGMWVREIKADAAFHPRIILTAGCPFMDVPAQTRRQPDAKAYRFATLGGQLRWGAEDGPIIGDLSFPRNRAHCKSTDNPLEQSFEMSCDVPYHVLRRLDERRAGGPVVAMGYRRNSGANHVLVPFAG